MTNTLDRLGRPATVVCNGMTTTLGYSPAGALVSETFSGGTLNGLAVTNDYDARLRRTAVGLNTQPSTLVQYGYDAASRLAGVTNGNSSAAYYEEWLQTGIQGSSGPPPAWKSFVAIRSLRS